MNGIMSLRRQLLLAAGVAAVLTATRWPLAPRHLYYFDSVNFALALEEFNPAMHQPQPPGYPLFVALARLLRAVAGSAEHAFVLAGVIAGTAGLVLLHRLGTEMFAPRVGLTASLLLAFHPVFWFGGITNQVRVFLAAGAAAVALAAWRAWLSSTPGWFYLTAVLLGLAGGFRPGLLIFLVPLLAVTGIRGKRSAGEWLIAITLLTFSVWIWLGWTIASVGGPGEFVRVLRTYAQEQFRGSSVVFGATAPSARRMAEAALVWNWVGALSWIWAVPALFRHPLPDDWKKRLPFLAVWFLPGFVFHAFIHVGDPDHTLVTVPVTCLLGALAITGFCDRAGALGWNRRRLTAVSVAVAINAFLFFRPLPGVARATSYRAVSRLHQTISSTLDTITELRVEGPVFLILWQSQVPWRHFSYYFPECPMLVLEGDPRTSTDASRTWSLSRGRIENSRLLDGKLVLPARGALVWLMPNGEQNESLFGDEMTLWKRKGPVLYMEARPGLHFQFGVYRFATQEDPAQAQM